MFYKGRNVKSIILAAGYGTRLAPHHNEPKCLIEISGKPVIENLVRKIDNIDEVDKTYIITNHKFNSYIEDWLKNFRAKKEVKVVDDGTTSNENRLGAIGDLEFLIKKEKIDDDILCLGGDNLFEDSLRGFVKFFNYNEDYKKGPLVGLYDVKSKEEAKRFGVVELNEDNSIASFEEKPENPKSTLVSTCAYIYNRDRLGYIDLYLKKNKNPDAPGNFPKWLHKLIKVYGFVFQGKWEDIGSIESMNRAKESKWNL